MILLFNIDAADLELLWPSSQIKLLSTSGETEDQRCLLPVTNWTVHVQIWSHHWNETVTPSYDPLPSSPGVYPRSWPPRCWAGAPELSGRSWTRAPETQSHWWPGHSCGGSGPEGRKEHTAEQRWQRNTQFEGGSRETLVGGDEEEEQEEGAVTVPGTWLLLGWARSRPGTGRWSSPGRRAHPAAAGAASGSGRCSALWLGPAPATRPAPAPCTAAGGSKWQDKEGHVSELITSNGQQHRKFLTLVGMNQTHQVFHVCSNIYSINSSLVLKWSIRLMIIFSLYFCTA